MTSKHTPGPWRSIDNSWEMSSVYADEGETLVAEVPINSSVDEDTQDKYEGIKEANASLIAAAPEVLSALKLFVRAEKMARDGIPPQDADRLIEIGEAAIEKAEDRS